MKKLLCLFLLFSSIGYAQHSDFIHVDQFGYQTNHRKVAVISSPQIGFNSSSSFTPNSTLEVRNANTNTTVFTGSIQSWNNGNTHSQSGDIGWWFDFSSLIVPGEYYIFDPINNETSAVFEIADQPYNQVLIAASKMFYYNRSGIEKVEPYVLSGYTDNASFLHDGIARDIYDQTNTSTQKDMSGGWFDAGDFNKYVTFTESTLHGLLWAYRENPSIFSDNFVIPESGNGVPDILDEIKWELDWLLKMINSDGSVHIKIGSKSYDENVQTPPSLNNETRFYAPTCTSAAIATSGILAHAAKVFSDIPSLSSYAQTLEDQALLTWNWVQPFLINDTLQTDCDDGSVLSGDADRTAEVQKEMALTAATYLFDLTSDTQFNQYIIDNLNDSKVINNDQWDNYNIENIDALLHYTTLPNADANTINTILNSAQTAASNNFNDYFEFNDLDLYRSYSNDWTYHWGSNSARSSMGVLNLIFNKYNINDSANRTYSLRAKEMLHYFHGVNPLDLVYLSNMSIYGAENSINQVYHNWFDDGSVWDDVQSSTYGPAPGYLVGGPNQNYAANTNLTPPYNQPLQKSYLDFNTGFPDDSWELSEPAIYYQSAYVRLLAGVMTLNSGSVLSTEDNFVSQNQGSYILYPNPSNEFFQITIPDDRTVDVLIYDLNGKLLLTKTKISSTDQISIGTLNRGDLLHKSKRQSFDFHIKNDQKIRRMYSRYS